MIQTLNYGANSRLILPLVAGAILGAAIVGAWLGPENRRLRPHTNCCAGATEREAGSLGCRPDKTGPSATGRP